MFVVKCLPFIGTVVTAGESVKALVDGDGEAFFSKLVQTGFGGGMDTLFVLTMGGSSLLKIPANACAAESARIISKKALEKFVYKGATSLTANVFTRAAVIVAEKSKVSSEDRNSGRDSSTRDSSTRDSPRSTSSRRTGNGNGSDPPSDRNPNLPNEHERDENTFDSGTLTIYLINFVALMNIFDFIELDGSGSVITDITLGPAGRVEKLKAVIKKKNLRPRGQNRRNMTARVRNFVRSLGQVRSNVRGVRESDEVGHIVGDCLGGPHDRTYNFFPQSPHCNMTYYIEMEDVIYRYLARNGDQSYVTMHVELVYVDYMQSPNRPRMIKVRLEFSNGETSNFEFSNNA